jgi:hypothetical protein
MTITYEMYATKGKDSNSSEAELPDVEVYAVGTVETGYSDPFPSWVSLVRVTSDADDLISFGPDEAAPDPNLALVADVARWWRVPRGRSWTIRV